jgi:flagellar hook-associated protein 2
MSSGLSLGGLASGLDTKAIIEQMMALERRPIDNLKAKQSAHGGRMTAIQSVKDLITALQSAARGLAERSKMNAKSAVTDTPSTSPSVLTASASADAINGSFKVTVKQLATSTRVSSGTALGKPIDANATLAKAGFRYAVNYGTFRINGEAITVDETTTLNDLVADIAGIDGLSASLVADADGRPSNRIRIVADPGHSIQLGSLSDTSNALRLLNLSDAVISGDTVESSTNLGMTDVGVSLDKSRLVTTIPGNTAATTNSGVAASAGSLSTSITINGVTTAIEQADSNATAAGNAAFIAQAINGNANNSVVAAAQADGTITLTQKVPGVQPKIEITDAGIGTGLVNGTTQNGTDPIDGRFKINGVEVSYKTTDSITTIVNRINASSAGVSAFYDPVQDKLRLTASQTGARTMTLEETQGNFLAATGVLNVAQTLGQNAVFNIDAVNGGADLTSATNSVSGYLPGVNLTFKSASETPVTVTVTQDAQATTKTVKDFVTQFNNVLQKIEDLTKYDLQTKRSSALTGDSGLRDIQRQLRQMASSAALGATGTYRTLASIGISFGSVGSAAGTTNRLIVDDTKLAKALSDSPQAVESVLAGFAATTGAPTGTNVSTVSGTPQIHQDGTYHIKITDAGTGAYEAKFVTASGQTLWNSTGIMKAGQENSGVIPGLTVASAAAFVAGAEDTFTVSVSNRGIGVALNDYLNGLTSREGYFADRKAGDDSISKSFTDRLAVMQDRLDRKQASLEKKYTALETTLSRMQAQSNSLMAQLSKLNAS